MEISIYFVNKSFRQMLITISNLNFDKFKKIFIIAEMFQLKLTSADFDVQFYKEIKKTRTIIQKSIF